MTEKNSLMGLGLEFQGMCSLCGKLLTEAEAIAGGTGPCLYCPISLQKPGISCTKCNTTLIEAEEGQELCIKCVKDSSEGLRYNEGKLPYDLIPTEAEEGLARVLAHGAKKYSPRNWEKGMDWSIPYGALRRHLSAWWNGEELDKESGLSHLSHILCNTAFLIVYEQRGVGKDNRPVIKTIDPKNLPKTTELANQLDAYRKELVEKHSGETEPPAGLGKAVRELARSRKCSRCNTFIEDEQGVPTQRIERLQGKWFCKVCADALKHLAECGEQTLEELARRF